MTPSTDDRRLPEWTDHMLRNRLRAVEATRARQAASFHATLAIMHLLDHEASDIAAEIKRRARP